MHSVYTVISPAAMSIRACVCECACVCAQVIYANLDDERINGVAEHLFSGLNKEPYLLLQSPGDVTQTFVFVLFFFFYQPMAYRRNRGIITNGTEGVEGEYKK